MLTPQNQHEYEVTIVHPHSRKDIINWFNFLTYFYETKPYYPVSDCSTMLNYCDEVFFPEQCDN